MNEQDRSQLVNADDRMIKALHKLAYVQRELDLVMDEVKDACVGVHQAMGYDGWDELTAEGLGPR